MYCKKCEVKLEDGVTVCPTCGNKVLVKKITKIITISIVAIILLIVAIKLIINNNNTTKEKELLETQKVDITTISKNDSITFAGYSFKLPSDLQYSNTDSYIYAATRDLKISFKMNVLLLNYDNVTDNHKKFIEALLSSGIQVISYDVITIKETNYFLVALVQENKQYIYAITKLNTNYAVQALIETTATDGYETAISKINSIIKNYEKISVDLMLDNIGTLNDFLISKTSNNIDDLFKVTEN